LQLSNQFIQVLDFSLNKALNADPQKQHIISLTQYKKLRVTISDWNLDFVITPEKDKILVSNFSENTINKNEVDCCVTGKLFNFMKFASQNDAQVLIQSGLIQQEGDLHVLQNYKIAMGAFEISLPESLSKSLGPNISHLMFTPFKAVNQWFGHALKSTKKDITEYVQEESNTFPPKEEVDDFFDEIQETKLSLDRVEAKLQNYIKINKTF
jgi:ubiquinone biosynthesis protein UbiJ